MGLMSVYLESTSKRAPDTMKEFIDPPPCGCGAAWSTSMAGRKGIKGKGPLRLPASRRRFVWVCDAAASHEPRGGDRADPHDGEAPRRAEGARRHPREARFVDQESSPMPVKDDLIAMGFPVGRVDSAISAKGEDLEACLEHLVALPPEDSDRPHPVEAELMAMGFDKGRIKQAIRAKGEALEAALQWLVENGDRADDALAPPPSKVQRRAEPQPQARPAPAAVVPVPAARKAAVVPPPPRAAASSGSSSSAAGPAITAGTSQRSLKRLMKEYNELNALESQPGGCRKVPARAVPPLLPRRFVVEPACLTLHRSHHAPSTHRACHAMCMCAFHLIVHRIPPLLLFLVHPRARARSCTHSKPRRSTI